MVGHVFEYNPAVFGNSKTSSIEDEKKIGQVYYIYSTRRKLGNSEATECVLEFGTDDN